MGFNGNLYTWNILTSIQHHSDDIASLTRHSTTLRHTQSQDGLKERQVIILHQHRVVFACIWIKAATIDSAS